MKTCISFLRSVNIGGHNLIRMSDLTSMYVNLGYKNVKTYIQSGNVLFNYDGKDTNRGISATIEKAIQKEFNLEIAVMTRTVEELKDLFLINPYIHETGFDPARMAVIFLNETPGEDMIKKVAHVDYPPDRFMIKGSEVFIYCPNGFGNTKIYTGFFEKKMGVTGTGRNWKTITTLIELAEKVV